jgi:hypothetical protein
MNNPNANNPPLAGDISSEIVLHPLPPLPKGKGYDFLGKVIVLEVEAAPKPLPTEV